MSSSSNSPIYHVHHILVKHNYEAEDVLKLLKTGSSFPELAQKYSTCPSASKGGDLGKIKWGRADADFEDAVAILKPDEVTQTPVRTRFGYHLIWRRA